MKKIIYWFIPLAASIALFIAVRPTFAQLAAGVETFKVTQVGEEVGENGFRQIYYLDKDNNKVFITNSNYTNANPVTDGENVVWMGQVGEGWRIFLYNTLSSTTTQLTFTGIHVNPKVDKGKVVWEGQDEAGVWQVFLFDGTKIAQVTSGDMSLNPDIEGDFVVYGRKDLTGWRASLYSLKEKKEVDVTTGDLAQKPKLKGGKIILAGGEKEEEFALTASDLFVLDLDPLSVATTSASTQATFEEVAKELEATAEGGSRN
jgi:hypothetical protein